MKALIVILLLVIGAVYAWGENQRQQLQVAQKTIAALTDVRQSELKAALALGDKDMADCSARLHNIPYFDCHAAWETKV